VSGTRENLFALRDVIRREWWMCPKCYGAGPHDGDPSPRAQEQLLQVKLADCHELVEIVCRQCNYIIVLLHCREWDALASLPRYRRVPPTENET